MTTPRARFHLPLPNRTALELGERTFVMGVLNVTPDSFSDGGVAFEPARAIESALAMQADGADIIDVGAESTRPGAAALAADEEWARLRPVLKTLPHRLQIPVSIDTYKASVARRALDCGVAMVNDISGLMYDPALGALAASRRVPVVLMHTRGRPDDMYHQARYGDVVAEIARELQRRIERAVGCGIAWEALLIDPGLGFAKRAPQSVLALAALEQFALLGRPIVVGPSRKSFLTAAAGARPAAERDWATAAAVTAAVLAGAHIVRVHRVAEMVQVVRVADAIRRASEELQ